MADYVDNNPKYQKDWEVEFIRPSERDSLIGRITNVEKIMGHSRNRIIYKVDVDGKSYNVAEGYIEKRMG